MFWNNGCLGAESPCQLLINHSTNKYLVLPLFLLFISWASGSYLGKGTCVMLPEPLLNSDLLGEIREERWGGAEMSQRHLLSRSSPPPPTPHFLAPPPPLTRMSFIEEQVQNSVI